MKRGTFAGVDPFAEKDEDFIKVQPYAKFVAFGSVADVGEEWDLVQVDYDVNMLMHDLNIDPNEEFGGAFVRKAALERGDITDEDVLFFTGSVPDLSKTVYKVTERLPRVE